MRTDIRKYIKIVSCARRPNKATIHRRTSYSQFMRLLRQILSVDLIGKLPTSGDERNYVCTCLDTVTRYLVAYSIRKLTKSAVIRCLEQYLGVPTTILSDNGPCFISRKYVIYLKSTGIKVLHVTPYNPQSNPIERIYQEMNRLCRVFCSHSHKNWSDHHSFVK